MTVASNLRACMSARWLLRCMLIAALGAAVSARAQGAGCDEGVIRLPDRNGTIQICSALAAQVPQLSRQLTEATRTMGDQQAQIRELTRLVRGLNGASQGIGAERQATLLRNLSTELSRSQRGGDPQLRRAVETLSEQLETLREQMLSALRSQATAAAVSTAIQGPVGDSIARLEFGSAVRQLDDITARLKALQGQVSEVKEDTQAIRSQVQRIEERDLADRQAQEEQSRQFAQAPSQLLQLDLQLLTPPVIVGIPRIKSILTYRLIATQPALPWADAKLVLAFAPRGQPGIYVDATGLLDQLRVGGAQVWSLEFIDPEGDLSLCATVYDPLRKRRVTWRQEFAIDAKARTPTASPIRPAEIVLERGEQSCMKAGAKNASLESILPQRARPEVDGLANPAKYFHFDPTISRNANLRQGLWLIEFFPGHIPGPQPTKMRLVFSGTGVPRVLELSEVYGASRNVGENVRLLVEAMDREMTLCVIGPNPANSSSTVKYVATYTVSILPILPNFQKVELLRKGPPRLVPASQATVECDPPGARNLPIIQAGR